MPRSLKYQVPPAAFHQARGWMWRALGRGYLRLAGWRIEGVFPADPKYVVIVAPHTSNWDFPLGVAVLFALELRISWLAKHSMFIPPFQHFFRWFGGIPINRSASHGVVRQCVRAFAAAPSLMLALAPEGTRKGVSQWKSGFYLIAVQAGVPILPVGFDYREHVVRVMPLFQPSGNLEQDLALIQAKFSHIRGYRERPAKAATD
ncbi:MAG: lysophospholipid acyltransferase family protein [Verrucomicrobiota bacterium]